MITRLLRIAALDVLRQLVQGRWRAVLPIFVVVGYSWVPSIEFDFEMQTTRNINVWDVPAAILTNPFSLSWMYLVGFTLLVGDSLVRDREQGTVLSVMVRVPSRSAWWLAKVLAVFSLAQLYVMTSFVGLMLGAFMHGVPLAMHDSPTALMLVAEHPLSPLYFRAKGIPMWLYVPGLGLYSAFALSTIEVLVLSISLFWSRFYVPLFATGGLIAIGMVSGKSLVSHSIFSSMVDTSYFLSYVKHFTQDIFPCVITLSCFLVMACLMLCAFVAAGAWRLRNLDL